jgi:hypothetical protein
MQWSLGGRENDGGDGGDGIRRWRPSFNGRRRRAQFGLKGTARRIGKLGVGEGGAREALGA